MMKSVVGVLVVSVCCSCGSAESDVESHSIAGTYVREYTSEILNELSGNKVGMRTIRDTLFISLEDNSYKVVNTKWAMNDYDQDGWRNMEHGEFGPMATFDASYDEELRTLSSKISGVAPELIIGEDGSLSVGKKAKVAYAKVD